MRTGEEPTADRMPSVKVAIVIQDVIGERLAGPAIRALAMARVLTAAHHEVRVHSTSEARPTSDLVIPGRLSARQSNDVGRWADVIVIQGDVLDPCPGLARGHGCLVVDLYDPVELEGLVRGVDLPTRARFAASRHALNMISGQIERGDLFLCASERQRLFWLGHLDAAGRVNPSTFDADPTLGQLLRIAPFGIEERPPTRDGPGLRDRVPGIDKASRVVLWGGGLYDWLDPLPVIDAVAGLLPDVPELRLVFMGTVHPNPAVRPSAVLAAARARVTEHGIGSAVTFYDGWVPYDERHNVLLDAEIGVSGHVAHVETALSFRTRILDYIWSSLPVVTTSGDALGDLVMSADLGVAVAPGDADAVEAGLRSLLFDPARVAEVRSAIERIAPSMRWSAALRPLVDYCADPKPAADRDDPESIALRRARGPRPEGRRVRARDLRGAVRDLLAAEGPSGVARKILARVRGRRDA